jgi:hypothetical protein
MPNWFKALRAVLSLPRRVTVLEQEKATQLPSHLREGTIGDWGYGDSTWGKSRTGH